MKQILSSLLLTILLTACGTTGQINQSHLDQPIKNKESRIIIERDTSLMYFGAAATVQVNGQEVAQLGRGGSVVKDVRAGKTTLRVTTPTAFGSFVVTFDAKSRETHRFVVSPRTEALFANSTFGIIGEAINASVNENSGYFQIEPTQPEK